MEDKLESDYQKLTKPTLEPQIPDYLLEGLSPEMRHLMNEISLSKQYQEWAVDAMINTNEQVRKTNGRLKKVEHWKDKLTHTGTLILAGLVIFSSVFGLVHKILDMFGKI